MTPSALLKAELALAARIRRDPFSAPMPFRAGAEHPGLVRDYRKPVKRLTATQARSRLSWVAEPVTDTVTHADGTESFVTYPNADAWLIARRLELGIATAGEATAYATNRTVKVLQGTP